MCGGEGGRRGRPCLLPDFINVNIMNRMSYYDVSNVSDEGLILNLAWVYPPHLAVAEINVNQFDPPLQTEGPFILINSPSFSKMSL